MGEPNITDLPPTSAGPGNHARDDKAMSVMTVPRMGEQVNPWNVSGADVPNKYPYGPEDIMYAAGMR